MRGERVRVRGCQRSVVVAAVALFAALPCAAQMSEGAGVLDVTVSLAEITVGDRVEARLTLVWTGPEPAAAPRFPGWQTHWGEAEVLTAGEVVTLAPGPGGQRIYTQDLILTAFATGSIRLPEVTVAIPLDDETIAVSSGRDAGFEVLSVLSGEVEELEPRPPAPPRRLAAEPRFAWTVAGLAVLALLAWWLFGRRLRVGSAGAAAPPRAEPLAELLQRLRRLDPAAAEPAHTGLSLGLRTFLGRSLGFPAAESTTTEIDRRLHRASVGAETVERTVRLLRDCDQVKFARVPVGPPVTRDRLRQARDLGQRIDRGLRPADDVAPSPRAAGGDAR